MRVVVIGGTNFMGPPTVRRLVDWGHEVTVFHRGETETRLPEGVRELLGDRRRLREHADDLRGARPEVVLDMVAMNEGDARGLVEVFGGVAGRVVAASSADVYRAYDVVRGLASGPPDQVPLDEDAPLRERLYPYERPEVEGYEKILVERVVMGDAEMAGTVLRLPMVYGPEDYMNRMYPYLKRMGDGRQEIPLEEGFARWRWTMGYVEDVAEAIALAVADDRASGRVYNVGERNPLTQTEWIRSIGEAVGWPGEVVAVPHEDLPTPGLEDANWDQDLITDTERIRLELGFEETVSREEAIQRTARWERENPPESTEEIFDYAAEDATLARARAKAEGH